MDSNLTEQSRRLRSVIDVMDFALNTAMVKPEMVPEEAYLLDWFRRAWRDESHEAWQYIQRFCRHVRDRATKKADDGTEYLSINCDGYKQAWDDRYEVVMMRKRVDAHRVHRGEIQFTQKPKGAF